MVITVIRVATPIVSPSMVSDARNLCARRALRHSAKLSRTASMGAEQFSRYFTESCGREPPIRWRRSAHTLDMMPERVSREYDGRNTQVTSFGFSLGIYRSFPRVNRSEEHTSELQSHSDLVCRLLLEKKKSN